METMETTETTARVVDVSLQREDVQQQAPAREVCVVCLDDERQVTPAHLRALRALPGSWEYTERWLEDMDDFEHTPGWEYAYPALAWLIEQGYVVRLDEAQMARFTYAYYFELRTREQLERHFQRAGRAERRARYQEEKPKHAAFLREIFGARGVRGYTDHMEQGRQEH